MDFFNPMYWSLGDKSYTEFASIYPPMVLLALKSIGVHLTHVVDLTPNLIRDNLHFIYIFTFFYLLFPFLVIRTRLWSSFSYAEKLFVYLMVIFSTPMLFALERGNLILITPLFLALAFSAKGLPRALWIALLINIKPYFAVFVILYFIIKDWKGLFETTLLASLIFFLTGLAFDPKFFLFFKNIFNFSQGVSTFSLRELMAMPSSISAFSYFAKNPSGLDFLSKHLTHSFISNLSLIIESTKWIALLSSIIVLVKKSEWIEANEVLVLLTVFISNLGIWVGGYTLALYFVLIPVLNNMRFRSAYFALLILIAAPLDLVSLMSSTIGNQYSYLSDTVVNVEWSLGLGAILRPCLNFFFLNLLLTELLIRGKSPFDSKARL